MLAIKSGKSVLFRRSPLTRFSRSLSQLFQFLICIVYRSSVLSVIVMTESASASLTCAWLICFGPIIGKLSISNPY